MKTTTTTPEESTITTSTVKKTTSSSTVKPKTPSATESDSGTLDLSKCQVPEQWINDGGCDDAANNPECHFDGGDCENK